MSDILDSIEELMGDDMDFDLEGDILHDDEEDNDDLFLGEIVNPEMDELEAREVTEAIRSAATATYILLAQAHEGKAYKALGYDTWTEYVSVEFSISPQRSYQLLDLSKAVKMIEASAPEGTVVKLTEAQARGIKKELPKITEQIAEATEGKTPAEAEEEIERIVGDVREQKRLDDDAVAKKQAALDEAEQDGYRAGLEAAADAMLEADEGGRMTSGSDDGFIEVEVEGHGDNLSPESSMDLYNFFSVLTGASSLPEPDDFIKIIPESRADEIENQIIEATAWFNRFHTLWEMRKA